MGGNLQKINKTKIIKKELLPTSLNTPSPTVTCCIEFSFFLKHTWSEKRSNQLFKTTSLFGGQNHKKKIEVEHVAMHSRSTRASTLLTCHKNCCLMSWLLHAHALIFIIILMEHLKNNLGATTYDLDLLSLGIYIYMLWTLLFLGRVLMKDILARFMNLWDDLCGFRMLSNKRCTKALIKCVGFWMLNSKGTQKLW